METKISGKYSHQGDFIIIETPGEGIRGVRELELHTATDDYQYRTYLKFGKDGERFWGYDSKYERSSEIAYRPIPDSTDVYPMIAVNSKGVCNDAGVSIRKGPGTSFDRVLYSESMHLEPQKFLPKGTEVYVYGHLKEADEIDTWFNYWYLIRLFGEATNDGPAWVFGEFIDVEGLEAPKRH